VATDFSRYQPPGVYTEAVPGPQLSVQSQTPTSVGLFGMTIGYRKDTESLVIDPDLDETTPATNRTLRQAGIRTDTVQVRNPNSGELYNVGTDYTVETVTVGGDALPNTRDDLFTINRVVDGGHIDPGDTVEVAYNYVDDNYFDAYSFYDYDDVRDAYGDPFDDAGNIQSELSLAAKFAFQNGAQRIICAAVDPSSPDAPTLADYEDALDRLKDESDISVIVPATGMQTIQTIVQAHVNLQSKNRYERRAIIGRDGSGTAVSSAQRITDAQGMANSRIAMVSPATMKYFAPELNREIIVGSQFLAAAAAGIAVSQNPAQPLTRRQIVGFADVAEKVPESQKNLESQNGLMVIEKTRRNSIRVRHGVTTNPQDTLTREWSVVGQEDAMVYRLREYLDNDRLIGDIIDDLTMVNVKASADAALQSLVRDRIVRGYRDLKVRQLETQPDVLEIRYEWIASLPLNYLVVRYSLSVTTGEVASV
jgi:hypothetical protein